MYSRVIAKKRALLDIARLPRQTPTPVLRSVSALLPIHLYLPKSHSTFHISKTLNHLSVLSRAWLGRYRPQQPSARSALREDCGGMQQPPSSCTFVLVRGHSYPRLWGTAVWEGRPVLRITIRRERQPSHPGCFGTNRIHRHRLVNSGLEITLTDRVPVTAISTENRNAARR